MAARKASNAGKAGKAAAAPHSRTNGRGGNGHAPTGTAHAGNGAAVPKGTLVIIGGKEDKEGEREILRDVVARMQADALRAYGGSMVVATISSGYPREVWNAYSRLFRELGVNEVSWLDLEERGGAFGAKACELLGAANAVFFTGGDQVRITSRLAGTPLDDCVRQLYYRGGVVAGTSAGATAMSEVMLIAGQDEHLTKIRTSLHMAPGLGLLPGVIIDQHFAERGRLNRLVGAVTQNPRLLGIGIDENTAIVVEGGCRFQVLGGGAVHIVDALGESYTNLHDTDTDEPMTVFDLRLHILSAGARFDLATRRPGRGEQRKNARSAAERERAQAAE